MSSIVSLPLWRKAKKINFKTIAFVSTEKHCTENRKMCYSTKFTYILFSKSQKSTLYIQHYTVRGII